MALDGVSWPCDEGSVLVLLGTSGSGKTTALKTDQPPGRARTRARSRVLGRDVARVGPDRRCGGSIGYVIQEAGLLPHLHGRENVGLVPRLLGWPAERRGARARELLALVGLTARPLRRRCSRRELSGGERQRVGLARALAADPPLLLMDEPFGALDPLTRRRLQDEFRALQQRLGKTVVLVTHDVPEALRLGDEVAVMDRGPRPPAAARPREIRERAAARLRAGVRGARRCRLSTVGCSTSWPSAAPSCCSLDRAAPRRWSLAGHRARGRHRPPRSASP